MREAARQGSAHVEEEEEVVVVDDGDDDPDPDALPSMPSLPPPPSMMPPFAPATALHPPRFYYQAFASLAAEMHEKDRSFQAHQHQLAVRTADEGAPKSGSGGSGSGSSGPADPLAPTRVQFAAQRSLSMLRTSAAPSIKLEYICAAVSALASAGEGRWGADDVLSMLVLAMLRSDVRAPHAEAAFITHFAHEGVDLGGASGYCLACFEAAAEAAATLALDELLLGRGDDIEVATTVVTPPAENIAASDSAALADAAADAAVDSAADSAAATTAAAPPAAPLPPLPVRPSRPSRRVANIPPVAAQGAPSLSASGALRTPLTLEAAVDLLEGAVDPRRLEATPVAFAPAEGLVPPAPVRGLSGAAALNDLCGMDDSIRTDESSESEAAANTRLGRQIIRRGSAAGSEPVAWRFLEWMLVSAESDGVEQRPRQPAKKVKPLRCA